MTVGNRTKCPNCKGNGYYKCPECQGARDGEDGFLCRSCVGKGLKPCPCRGSRLMMRNFKANPFPKTVRM
jgi:hypothetical protein